MAALRSSDLTPAMRARIAGCRWDDMPPTDRALHGATVWCEAPTAWGGTAPYLRLTLPLPPELLSPNARAHHMKIYRAKQKYGAVATATVLSLRVRPSFPGEGRLSLTYTFYHSIRKRRDDDNLAASMKHARDSIAQALGFDDSRFLTQPVIQRIDRDCPRVVVAITPVETSHGLTAEDA